MKHWDDDARAEFDLAVDTAWRDGRNNAERADEFVSIVKDAEQAQRSWASDVLKSALYDGMWKLLKDHHRAIAPLKVAFAGRTHAVPRLGGIGHKSNDGITFEQLEFVDMSREQLLNKQGEYKRTAFAARRDEMLVNRLVELIDKADGATTAREAAAQLGIDIEAFLAGESS